MPITPLPTAPAVTDTQASFNTKAFAWVAALATFVTQTNTTATEADADAAAALSSASTAATQAGIATTQAGTATTQAGISTTKAGEANTSAIAAAVSAASAAAVAGSFVGTSTSSVLIGLGNKTFVTQSGEQYTTGLWMTATSNATPSNYMFGQVVSYSGTSLVIDVQATGGTGTYSDWNLSLAGPRGATGATGTGVTNQNTGFTLTGGTTNARTLTVDITGTAALLESNAFTGLQKLAAGANIASAATIDLTAATGNTVVITGTVTTTALTMTAGQQMCLLPSAAWPMTFNATTMNINGGVSQTCAAGDRVWATKDLAGVIRVELVRQSGAALVNPVATATVAGLVPTPPNNTTTFLRGDATFAAPAAGALVFLSTVTASASATVDIETTLNGTYDQYVIIASNILFSDTNISLRVRYKIAGAYSSTALYGGTCGYFSTGGSANVVESVSDTTQTQITLTPAANIRNTASAYGMHMLSVWLVKVADTTMKKIIRWEGAYAPSGSPSSAHLIGSGQYDNSSAVTGIRFFASAGTITSGTFRLYGIANS